jgi:hypothetical protein
MRAHWNFWAPDNTFAAAYNAGLAPSATPPGTTHKVELDRVQIERFDTTKGPNLLVDPSFENQTDAVGGIGGWQRFNNAGYDGVQLGGNNSTVGLKVYGPFRGSVDASGAFQSVAAAPGQEFEGSVWAHAPSFDAIKGNQNYTALTLQFCDLNNAVIGSVNFSPGTNQKETPIYDGRDSRMIEDEWVQYTVNGVAPAGTAYARINLFFIQLMNQGGAVWFDDAELARLTSTAPVPNADFDGNGKVDGTDFLTWQRGFNSSGTLATGDANGDQVVDGADLAIWQSQFGTVNATPAAGAVPEPASWAIAGALAGLALVRRRRA